VPKQNRPQAGFLLLTLKPSFPEPQNRHSRLRGNDGSTDVKKPARRPVFSIALADYFEAAGAAAAEAASAAAEAAEAAAEAAEAAASAAAGAAGAAVVSAAGAAGAAAGAAAVVSAAGAAAGASSFFEQAARATASRETISRDFFMIFSLINSKR
jgi:hypothetical protein